MTRLERVRRVGSRLGLIFVAIGLLIALNLGRLVGFAMTPGLAFDTEIPPSAPDYASSESWSALPNRNDLADRAPIGATAVDQAHAEVDVFYVHPTSYIGSRWNAPADDASVKYPSGGPHG